MLISKTGIIKVDGPSKTKYINLGYKFDKVGEQIDVLIEHLTPSSRAIIRAQCDYCLNIIEIKYSNYNNNIKLRNKFACSDQCSNNKYKETCLEKFGVENISQLPETHLKTKKTNLERYGVDSYAKSPDYKAKSEKTCMEKYGVTNTSLIPESREKYKATCLVRFGVENASQSPVIFAKQQKARYEVHKFRNTDLYYQGSYEKDFLDKYYDCIIIERMTFINYNFEDNKKVYFPDFYLPDYNLIVEVKSSYTYNRYLDKNLAKEKTCKELGYNFIFIINKNYEALNKLIFQYIIN